MSTKKTPNHFSLSCEQKLKIVKALIERNNVRDEARKALCETYPNASNKMIDTAVFHIYVDGIQAAIDWLVDIELFLQDSKHTLNDGVVFHLIYHLYNWLQFKSIMPETNEDFMSKLADIEAAIEDDDKEAALDILEELKDKFNGSLNPPNFWAP